MRSVIETFVTVLIAGITIIMCAQFISIQIQTNNAKDLHTTYISVIEASDFDNEVIGQCKQDAVNKGYELVVNNTSEIKNYCASCGKEVPESETLCTDCGGSIKYTPERECEVSLKYKLNIPILQLTKEGVVNGYAR